MYDNRSLGVIHSGQLQGALQEILVNNGLLALFALSFLAATIIPLGSEWLLIVLLMGDINPVEAVLVAAVGNYLGACTTYLIGIWGSDFLIHRIMRISDHDLARAETLYEKYGCYSLLFSWLPVVGDPLCLIGGVFRINFILFSTLVFSGKLTRYATLALFTVKAVS